MANGYGISINKIHVSVYLVVLLIGVLGGAFVNATVESVKKDTNRNERNIEKNSNAIQELKMSNVEIVGHLKHLRETVDRIDKKLEGLPPEK